MKISKNFIPTLKEVPTEAVMPSHQLMLRAGLVRQVAAGVFSFLPFGYRILKKVINILREEMDAIGGQEFFMPALNPIEIWEQTGRVEAMGDVMFHIKNRDGLVLAPTHEEIITFHARQHIQSYRVLPQIWYQIQTKFRNEPRPKSGVMRGRQFFMKDAYSLDATWEGLDVSYQKHYEAYRKIFDRCGIKYFIVGASSGAMGGKQSQEFMVESEFGEDTCAVCEKCGYAANLEVASSNVATCGRIDNNLQIEEFPTPNAKSIDDLIEQFGLSEDRLAKSVVYIADSKPVLVLMRGNDELNETKLQAVLGATAIRPAEAAELVEYTGANAGSIGPVNLKENIKIIADNRLLGANNMVSGANKDGFHNKNIDLERDAKIEGYFDLRVVQSGENCPHCNALLKVVNAIELGHIFKLGTRYSQALGATFLDEKGEEHPIIMGSYGIGVERILACFIEQHHDDKGIIWKKPLNPYDVHLIGLNTNKFEDVKNTCESLYEELLSNEIDVLYDDRDESPGVKFNDADLLGMPYQIIVSKKNIEAGCVEMKIRETGERKQVKICEVVNELK
ncbi:MAG TPA: proline--tRNA ligase [Candidatus Kapabacteria bacterium]|nr:proline--tRNA ligase [Candidatus Kapabacteria bacterium]